MSVVIAYSSLVPGSTGVMEGNGVVADVRGVDSANVRVSGVVRVWDKVWGVARL